MNSPSSETLSTEDAVQTIGGRNTRGDKSDSPGRRNEKSYARTVFNFCTTSSHPLELEPQRHRHLPRVQRACVTAQTAGSLHINAVLPVVPIVGGTDAPSIELRMVKDVVDRKSTRLNSSHL